MGFWNALSVLAPVAPALSDARDLRTAREQDAAKFASDQALAQAQLTASRLAAQSEQQRLTQGAQPTIIGEPQWDATKHAYQVLTFDKNTGALALKDAPGVDPAEAAEARYQAARTDYKKVAGRDLTPEEDQELFFQSYGYKAPVPKVSQLTGDAGKPFQGADKQWYVNAKNADGSIVTMPLGPNYQPPAPRPTGSPAATYANLQAKKILADRKQGPPLTAQEEAQREAALSAMDAPGIARGDAFARAAAANNLIAITDPNTGMDTLVTRAQAVQMANTGAAPLAGVVSSPTGLDKKNQMLAVSAIQQVNRMESILNRDPNLTGPGAGQLTQLQTFLGSQDPDAQAFLMSSLLGSEHGVAVFGGRNIHTIQDLQNTLGAWKTNPAALRAALQVIRETMTPWATAGGRLPGPRGTGAANSPASPGGAAPSNTITIHAGGKTYNIPRDQVVAFRKDHPDAKQ